MEALPYVDRNRVGALGFCYGGRYALTANSLFPLSAGVTFYGNDMDRSPFMSIGPGSPHLFFWGGQDVNNPAHCVLNFEQNLAAGGRDFTSVSISYAGNGFFCEQRSSYNPLAARQAWGHTLSFFDYLLR
jgi:carboxymethylenebutenolidase